MTGPKSLPLRICETGAPLSYDQVIVRDCPAAPAPPALSDLTMKGSRSAMTPTALRTPHVGDAIVAVTFSVSPEPMAMSTRSVPAPLRSCPPSMVHE